MPKSGSKSSMSALLFVRQCAYPIQPPDPISAIEFIMEQKGFGQSDLAKLIGKSRASDILNRKRSLSRSQAITLYNEWGVSAESLLSA